VSVTSCVQCCHKHLWEPTKTHLHANYQILVDRQSEASLANKRGSWQCQRRLGWAPLTTDADHIALVRQSELPLLRDSIWSAHGHSDPPSCVKLDKPATETLEMLREAFGEHSLSRRAALNGIHVSRLVE
jgi:hypothetical protein